MYHLNNVNINLTNYIDNKDALFVVLLRFHSIQPTSQ